MGIATKELDEATTVSPRDDAAESLAFQNKGGIALAILGAALGLWRKNPLLAFVGLIGGFLTGSLSLDRDKGAVQGMLADLPHRQTTPQLRNGSETNAGMTFGTPASGATEPLLHDVSFDLDFSQSKGSLPTSHKLAARIQRHHR
jgi:hypothetical protein